MSIVLYAIAGLFVVLGLAIIGLWVLGTRQPSVALSKHKSILFVALKHDDPEFVQSANFLAGKALWRGQAQYAFVGTPEVYWTDYIFLPADPALVDGLGENDGFADAYIAQVDLLNVPAIALGLLRAQHLLGITKRPVFDPAGADEAVGARPDVMPTAESLNASLEMDQTAQISMMNFLEYYADENGDKERARRQYQRYGKEAMKAVHMVGGQFLFAGRITRVLAEPRHQPAPVLWDDLAAMIYPDPMAIFGMERSDAYRAALKFRDEGLKSSDVIATVSY